MAITLGDLAERLAAIKLDIEELNFGHAKMRVDNLMNTIENSGIVIHAVATTQNKKVESNDGEES